MVRICNGRAPGPCVRNKVCFATLGHALSSCAMSWIVTKYLVTAAVVVLVSEAAARSDRLGGLIASLPLVTVLTLIWLHVERQPQEGLEGREGGQDVWEAIPAEGQREAVGAGEALVQVVGGHVRRVQDGFPDGRQLGRVQGPAALGVGSEHGPHGI